jgi:hypothetical protein
MAACLWQAYPEKTNMAIYQAIIQSAHQYTHPDSLMGYGIPNFVNALYLLGEPQARDPNAGAYAAPVPFSDFVNLYFVGGSDYEGSLDIFDMTNRLVRRTPFSFRAGTRYAVPVNMTAYPAGAYAIRINKQVVETVQVLKVY